MYDEKGYVWVFDPFVCERRLDQLSKKNVYFKSKNRCGRYGSQQRLNFDQIQLRRHELDVSELSFDEWLETGDGAL